jgi:hypothetical protein
MQSKFEIHYEHREPIVTFTMTYTKAELDDLVDIKRKLDKFEGHHDPLKAMVNWLTAIEHAHCKLTKGDGTDANPEAGAGH